MCLQRLGLQREARDTLEQLRRLPPGDAGAPEKGLTYTAERMLAGADTEAAALWRCLEEAKLDEAACRLLETPSKEDLCGVRQAVAGAFYERARGRKYDGGDFNDAMSDYGMTVQLDPNHIRARCDLAWLQAACPAVELQDGAQAVANATQACEATDWRDHSCLATLAAVCAQVDDFPAAGLWQQKAIGLLTHPDAARWQADYASRLHLYESGAPYTGGNLWSFSTGRLLGWWRFDEHSGNRVADASGNDCNGMIAGTPWWQPSGGRMGGAIQLQNACVRIAPKAPFDITDAITLSVWTRVDRLDRWWQALVTKGDDSWRLHRFGDRDTLEFACSGLHSPHGTSVSVEANRVINDGRWHHIAATYDGRRISLYMDGRLENSRPAWGQIATNDSPVLIGDNAQQSGRCWNGWIDEVRIYSYALSADEVVELHAAGEQPVMASYR